MKPMVIILLRGKLLVRPRIRADRSTAVGRDDVDLRRNYIMVHGKGDKEGYLVFGPKTRELLVCPVCKGRLHYLAKREELACTACSLAYPIRDGIPVMLEEEARVLPTDEKDALKRA
jgi:uncharacterized protein